MPCAGCGTRRRAKRRRSVIRAFGEAGLVLLCSEKGNVSLVGPVTKRRYDFTPCRYVDVRDKEALLRAGLVRR